MAGTPTPGFKVVIPLYTFPTAGLAASAVVGASRLDLDDAGWTTIDYHVLTAELDSGDYYLLRYWPDDQVWRMERPAITFGAASAYADRPIAPCGIPTGGGSFCLFRNGAPLNPDYAVMKACIRR